MLGEAATDGVIDAWAEAYGVLADIFIQREAQIYHEHERRHGWVGFRRFVIDRRVTESETITSFYLKPEDAESLAAFKPGQYLTVRVPLPGGGTTMRNYSLSSAPIDGAEYYRISVKRESALTADAPGGYVSHYLHDDVNEGDPIEVGPPCGDFTLDLEAFSDRTLVLISGGVGITPMVAMLHAAIRYQPDRPICFIHGALNSRTHALRVEIEQLEQQHKPLRTHVRYSEPVEGDVEQGRCGSTGFIDEELIRLVVGTSDGEFYYCGPKAFMVNVHRALDEWGVPANQCHHEFFGPAEALEPPAFCDSSRQIVSRDKSCSTNRSAAPI